MAVQRELIHCESCIGESARRWRWITSFFYRGTYLRCGRLAIKATLPLHVLHSYLQDFPMTLTTVADAGLVSALLGNLPGAMGRPAGVHWDLGAAVV